MNRHVNARSLPNLTAGHALSGSADARNDEMETMSQFANEKDLWKARCLRMARALVDGLDDVPDDDLLTHVAEALADAKTIVELLAPTDAKAKV